MLDTTQALIIVPEGPWISCESCEPRCVIGDGDTGFGGSGNIRRTIRGYAAAGAHRDLKVLKSKSNCLEASQLPDSQHAVPS